MPPTPPTEVMELISRSRSLGSEPGVTNYGGGNTSCKVEMDDPVTGKRRRLLYVKGSGGDLGTLSLDGLAVLDLDRVLELNRLYVDEDHEGDLMELLEFCRFGPPGPAPSLDTAFHALIPAAHIDHTHPTSVTALATSAEGPELTRRCFGGQVGWVDWRRPGFTLARDLAELLRDRPGLRGVVLGGHGLVSWGDTAVDCEETTRWIISTAATFISGLVGAAPVVRVEVGGESTRARILELGPRLRGLCSADGHMVAEFRDDPELMAFMASDRCADLVDAGTSCPDHLLRTRARPLLLPPVGERSEVPTRDELETAAARYRDRYRSYYESLADPSSPEMRGADPRVVLVPEVGMWSFGPTAREASIIADYFQQAVEIMTSADRLGGYEPISDLERFRIEYWDLEVAKLARRPPPPPMQGRVALVVGAASGIGRSVASMLVDAGAEVIVADLDQGRATEVAGELGSDGRRPLPLGVDLSDECSVREMVEAVVMARGGLDVVVNSAGVARADPLEETSTADWDLLSSVFSRGSFLVSREAARVMIDQGMAGHMVHVVSKNAVVAGPGNVAYSSAKASQLHLVRLLATELAPHGIRVNAVNPDAVVRGSGLFENEWGRARAAAHGVSLEDLPSFYAGRTLLGQEVLPEHVARAVRVLVDGTLPRTTGAFLPVDGGMPASFPR